MEIWLIALAAFASSALTFFSGFGLGTILLPVFTMFFPVEVAIVLTAIVHLLNNLFKFALTARHVAVRVFFVFGIPALLAAFLGAKALVSLTGLPDLYRYTLGENEFVITPVKLIVSLLLILFAVVEFTGQNRWTVNKKWLPLGGILSGFFGGLSGHQGALRSAFLVNSGLSKEAFIATGIAIALLVDVARLTVYEGNIFVNVQENREVLIAAIGAAFAGAFIGNRLLKKVTILQIQYFVGILLLVFSLLMGAGII